MRRTSPSPTWRSSPQTRRQPFPVRCTWWEPAWARLASEASKATLAATLLPWFFSPGFLADAAAASRTLRGLAQTVARVPATTLSRMTAGIEAWSGSRSDALREIRAPTLVIAAAGDLLTPDAAALAEAIPDARCVVVPDAGHAVALEAPQAVNDALLAHLDAARA